VEDPSSIIISDTSVLINFLAINRMDLIKRHLCRFMITNHVRHEVLDHYQDQFSRLQEVLNQGILEEISVIAPEEVETFVKLTELKRFGYGECACIAVAIHQGYALAIDDKKAANQARRLCPTINILSTQDLCVSMINAGLITVDEADSIKDEWASDHKFKLKINSFSELL
jgi:predicted nucleic acid-binding protein